MAIINNSASLTYEFGGLTDSAVSNTATTNLLEEYILNAVKLSQNSSWRPSENLTYVVRIENSGTQTIYAVTLQDDLGGTPPLLTFVPNSVIMNKNGVLSALTPTAVSPLTVALPENLAAGESVTITYIAKVRSDIGADVTEITNTVTVAGHEVSASGTVITVEPKPTVTLTKADYAEVRIEKRADKTELSTGESLTYTFVLENSGNTEATNVVITDVLPAGYEINSVQSVTGGVTTVFDPADYSVDVDNKLILPTSTTKTISVPAATGAGNGVTTITVVGVITA